MNKILGFLFSAFVFLLLVFTVSAQNINADIPERSGDYPVFGRSDLRVRVFVHEPKARPEFTASAACTDPHVNDVVGATGWKLPSTVNYKINPTSVPSSVGGSNLANLVSDSFASWTSAISSSAPSINSIGTTTKTRKALDGQNIIAWGRISGSALGITYTWYYTATNVVAETDTILNVKFPWSLDSCTSNSYDARGILVHELGHWFGLNDHYTSNYIDNTMFGSGGKNETKKSTLEQGDKTGINLIYP